jgi:c-di-AMP phosphodiesterase-like protein
MFRKMNLTKYTCLRFALYFIVFAVLILTCSKVCLSSFLGNWYIIVCLAALLTFIEFYIVSNPARCSQCLKKKYLSEVRHRLKQLGYRMTDNKVDRLIFLKRVNLIRWEIARIAFKKNHMELELPQNDVAFFNEWSVTLTDSDFSCEDS